MDFCIDIFAIHDHVQHIAHHIILILDECFVRKREKMLAHIDKSKMLGRQS